MTTGACKRVLTAPDLIALLADHLDRQDISRLGRTSRNIFSIIITYVWREVCGVHNLFKLIPGTKCKRRGSSDKWTFRIPEYRESTLARFSIYAPHVINLHILPTLHSSYEFSDWEKLKAYSEAGALPSNIQTLAFESHKSRDETFVRWIVPFLSTNVLTIRTHSHQWGFSANLSMRRATTFLKAISRHSPAITDFSFFPVEPYFPRNSLDNEDTSSGTQSPASPDNNRSKATLPVYFYDYLKQMHFLRNLTTTSFIIHSDALEILSRLPSLRELVLYCSYPNEYLVYTLSPNFLDGAFPSLNTLELLFPDMECLSQIWSLTPLVDRLTKVVVTLQASTEVDHDFDYDDEFDDDPSTARNFVSFIPRLCEYSSKIQELTVDFDAMEGDSAQTISLDVLKVLATLPLTALDLRHALLDEVPNACQVLTKCPSLRDLHLQDQTVSYEELLHFARIPSLECFHAEVRWGGKKCLLGCISEPYPSSNLLFLQTSNPPHLQNEHAALSDITRFLSLCLPKLEEVSYVGTSMYGVGPGYADETCVLLNKMMKKNSEKGEAATRRF